MKKRLMFLVSLVVILVLGTAVIANAGSASKITGSMKAEYGTGFNWLQINIHVSPEGNASGFAKYKSWTETPNEQGYWRGEPICVSFGEYEGMPAATAVQVFTADSDGVDVGKYAKGFFADGGPNARNDLIGLVVWPAVDIPPDCEFEEPFYAWSGLGGNITIHHP